MRRRTALTALASVGVATVLTLGIGAAALAGDRPPHRKLPAICDYRVCFQLVVLTADTDGDGYTDVDEIWAGTDPKDPKSHPDPQLLVDAFAKDVLPSFNAHLTEIVVLPVLTPDGTGLASVLGKVGLPLPARQKTTVDGLLGGLDKLGLDPLDIMATLTAKHSGTFGSLGQVPWSGVGGLGWLNVPNQGLYAMGAGGMNSRGSGASGATFTKWQPNKDGSVDFAGSMSFNDKTSASFYGGSTETGGYTQHDPDGTNGGRWVPDGGRNYQFVIEYKDEKGRKTKEDIVSLNTDKNGKVTKGKVITVTYDPETGEQTGKTEKNCTTDCPAPPSNPGGQTSSPKESSQTGDPKESESKGTESKDPNATPSSSGQPDSMCDSDGDDCYANSITFPLTIDEEKQLKIRLTNGTVTTPGPDEGTPIAPPEGFDPRNYDPNAPIKYVTDEGYGVVRISNGVPKDITVPYTDYPEGYQPLYDMSGLNNPCGPGSIACIG